MTPTYTGITAELKDYGIRLKATTPDDHEKTVFLDGSDIREFYSCNPAKWLEENEDNEQALWEAFFLIEGIKATA